MEASQCELDRKRLPSVLLQEVPLRAMEELQVKHAGGLLLPWLLLTKKARLCLKM